MHPSHAQAIAAFPMFQGYTSYGLDSVFEKGVVKELSAGDTLYTQGESASFVALVVSGSLEMFVETSGQVRTLAHVGPTRLLGELAVLAGAERVMSARAIEPSVVLQWDAESFRRLLAGDAQLSQRIFRETFRSIVEERDSLLVALNAAREGSGADAPRARPSGS